MLHVSSETRAFFRRAFLPYVLFIGALVAITAFAGIRHRVLVVLALLVLVGTACWLNDVVRRDREPPGNRGAARSFVNVGQLAMGLVLLFGGASVLGDGSDWFFFVGLALVVMALAGLISELRQTSWGGEKFGPVLFVFALLSLLIAAWLGPGWPFLIALGAGIVAGELATELISEASHRWGWLRRWWLVAAIGAVLLGVAWGAFVRSGVSGTWAPFLMLGLLAVVWMASSDTDSLLLVVVFAIALIWAASPTGQTLEGRHLPAEGKPYFLVLGDSYISGEGADDFLTGTNTTESNDDRTNECRRAKTAWPVLLADSNTRGVPNRLMFLGCSGAITENIHTEPRQDGDGNKYGPAELTLYERERDELGGQKPEFVLLSIGGNDASFGTIGQTCVGPGNCADIGAQFVDDLLREAPTQPTTGAPGKGRPEALAFIDDDLDAAYDRVDAMFDVPVIVVPYPIPLNATGECRDALLETDERRFIVAYVKELNRVVASAAARHGFHYMDTMETALEQRSGLLCDDNGLRAGLNFFAFNPKAGSVRDWLTPTNWTHNSLHPNADGHQALRDAANAWFGAQPDFDPPLAEPGDSHDVANFDAIMGEPRVEQCKPANERQCKLAGGRWLYDQSTQLYDSALLPLALTTVGGWLLLASLLRFGRDRRMSTAKIVRCALKRPAPPLPG